MFTYIPQLGTQVRSYVDVDLSDKNAHSLLRKLVKLSMCYLPLSGRALYTRYGLVLTKSDPNNPVCILLGDRFLDKDQVHSVSYSTTSTMVHHDIVEINDFDGVFNINNANKEWQLFNTYFPYDLTLEAPYLDLF